MNGKGGGKDLSAQATGTNPRCIREAMVKATQYACEKLGIAPPKEEATKQSGGASSGGNLLDQLNSHLFDKSYIEGYTPSQSDAVVFAEVGNKPPASSLVHALRWYNHMKSFGQQTKSFPGTKKTLEQMGLAGKGVEKAPTKKEDDDDFDLFGSEDEEEAAEAEKLKQERIAAYTAKKSKKPALVAKSSIILDVKPWDDETDMAALEAAVRTVKKDGLLWGASKFVPLAYGIKKLQICCVVEDDKIGTDFLEEEITKFEDLVQSVDIAAFNKI